MPALCAYSLHVKRRQREKCILLMLSAKKSQSNVLGLFFLFFTLEKPDVTVALQEGSSLQVFLCVLQFCHSGVSADSVPMNIVPPMNHEPRAERAPRLPFGLLPGHAASGGPGPGPWLPGKGLNGPYCAGRRKQQL